jgi:LmbE family N-acetylglucosaminyl deacetylase
MTDVTLDAPGPHGAVFLSPHEDDALFSCLARMIAAQEAGDRVLVVFVFARTPERGGEIAGALDALGVDQLRLGWAPAAERDSRYASFHAATSARHDDDALLLARLADDLNALVTRTRCTEVYLPLGLSGHVDHRLCLEAALRALKPLGGRSLFCYEERPAVFVPGAIRIRLGELAARLPPAASDVRDRGGLARTLVRFQLAPWVRAAGLRGLAERWRVARRLARQHRASRAWRPLRAFGLRLQPVLQQAAGAAFGDALAILWRCEARVGALFGSREQALQRAREYAQRLGAGEYAERYWLVLPERAEGGGEHLPEAERLVS